jgi:hypothetical protein
MDRARLAVTNWIPLSAIGAAITFVIGFVLHLPQMQLTTSTTVTAFLVFSGLAMNSYRREEQEEQRATKSLQG